MGKSSKDKRDAYYRLAKEQNWRARSAFKLIQIDEQFDLFSYAKPEQCTRVVDLCAAPGSWSQVLSRVLIKGESFGRRKWLEKMAKFESDMQQKLDPMNEASEEQLDAQTEEPAVLTETMSNLDVADENITTSHSADTNTDNTQSSPLLTGPELQPRKNVKIVAIDLQPMAPLPGITQLKADITHPSTVPLLLRALDIDLDLPREQQSLVDLVISDGAPDVTGLHDLDIYIQASLLHSALSLAIKVLRPGGKFVAKIFRGRNCDLIYAQLKLCFDRVSVAKPRSSRASSIEAFVVCEGFNGVTLDEDRMLNSNVMTETGLTQDEEGRIKVEQPYDSESQPTRTVRDDGTIVLEFPETEEAKRSNRWLAPFLACGDLDAYDADATYRLPPNHVSLPPVQPPTAPPYKEAIERRRMEGGMYGKTKRK